MNALALRTLFSALLLLLVALPGYSAATPHDMLQGVADNLFGDLKRDRERLKGEPEHLYVIVEERLVPHVDMPRMSRWILGKHWRTATPEQRLRFEQEFKVLLVRFYVAAILDDPDSLDEVIESIDNGLLTFSPARVADDATKATVKGEVKLPSGMVVPVSFITYRPKVEDAWKVIDVNVDGISIVTNYRSTFSNEVRRDGIDGMLTRLAERNRELVAKGINASKKE